MSISRLKISTEDPEQLSLFLKEEYKPIEIDTVYQYLVILSPPDETSDRIKRLKYQLNNLAYLGSYNLFSIPHITLTKLQSVHRANDRFGKGLQKEFMEYGELSIKLRGFNFFSHGNDSKTIYLQIEDTHKIEAIYTQLNNALGIPLKKDYVPHLTIAKTISAPQFDDLFPVLPESGFEDTFTCNHILVLERTIKNGKVSHYKPFKKIKLG
jgi:2'-5' RNA ligase